MRTATTRLLLTFLATVLVVGGLVRLALDSEVAEVEMPDEPMRAAPITNICPAHHANHKQSLCCAFADFVQHLNCDTYNIYT